MLTALASFLLVAGCLFWWMVGYGVLQTLRKVPVLSDQAPPEPARWPRLSAIVPACNEAAEIEGATRAKLSSDYPELELILVDDRSTDETGAIAERLAAADPRLKVVHVHELPRGWLGKLNAMQAGLEKASGEWLLFSDADVKLAPEALRRTVAYCESRGLDHLAVIPTFEPSHFLLDAALATFIRTACIAARVWAVEDPRSRASMGIGAFNLVRRSALERTGGFEYLKLEVADDAALGQMLKRSGARSGVVNGRGLVSLKMFGDLAGMARSAEKGVVVLGFKLLPAVFAGAVMGWLELGPIWALLFGGGWVRALGLATLGIAVASLVALARWLANPLLPAAATPLGSLIFTGFTFRAGVVASRRGGLVWRGTLYPARELIEGKRYQLR